MTADHRGGPLVGLTLGVKDIFDTADQPTEYGSPIYRGHRPRADAATVALLRAAGATVVGKTVTAEFAFFHPGPTTNPHRTTHTPGGSSSGSAAAVAAGMCDVALGTQTAGSVIRPASFCGVFGFKPTFGTAPVAGVKLVAPSLDTVGWFARDPSTLEAVRAVLTGRPRALGPLTSTRLEANGPNPGDFWPRIALVRTEQWDTADDDSRAAVEKAAERAANAGAAVEERDLPEKLKGLAGEQPIVQAFEGARSLAWEWETHRHQISESLTKILERGWGIDPDEYVRVKKRARDARHLFSSMFGDADVLLTPAVVGEAPKGLDSTGDPRFCRLWTILGLPTLSVPGLSGHTGPPIGVQLVGRGDDDAAVIAAGGWLASVV